MFMHPAMARAIVDERQSAARIRAAEIRRALHLRDEAASRRVPILRRARPQLNAVST
jgi:hypothetical protein